MKQKNYHYWTYKEKKYLIDNFHAHPPGILALKLGLEVGAVKSKAYRMGLTGKPKSYEVKKGPRYRKTASVVGIDRTTKMAISSKWV